jgi:tetratricopeptide (TPR) repeat protein
MIQRYRTLESISDLDAAIQVIEEGLRDDLSRAERAEFYAVLGTALRYRFNQLSDRADLDRAIDSYQRVIQEEVDDTVRAVALDNYANGLADRYHFTHNLADLQDAITSSHAALDLLPEGSPQQALILTNLGNSLFEMYAATRDSVDLFKEVEVLRRGLGYSTANFSVLQRLHTMLAQALLYAAVINSEPGNLVREALDHFAKAREITNSQGEHLIMTALLARERNLWVTDLEIGALLWQSELDSASAPGLLRRALEVGEGEKSRSLAMDLARRPLPRPADVPEELFEQERLCLGQLSALDNSEIAGIPWAHQVRNMGRRDDIQRELNSIWADITKASPAGVRYVQMRQSPDRTWLDSVHQLDRNTAVLSLLPIRNVRAGSVFEARGLVVLGVTSGRPEPFIIAKDLLLDPVPSAARQFEAEVPGDGGLGMRLETWHRPLQALLGNQTPDPIKQARTIIVSPPRDGHNLPWNLVLQRVGWRAEDGNLLPVITLPTLTILAPMSAPSGAEAGEQNKPLPKRMMYAEPRSVDEALKQVIRMAGGWSGPLVVGNPTEDLPAAEREARAVAAVLGVKPLIGRKVAKETVLKALYDAPIIHLAAHAWFDERDPLESRILVADGMISARDLVSSFCEAELVVLSSCEGGAASRVIGGEVAGLGHALLRAGARAVLASLWPVDDDATAFLMAEFYRARLSGVGEATALAQAMHVTSEQPLWRHPYFWSGFVLMQGE